MKFFAILTLSSFLTIFSAASLQAQQAQSGVAAVFPKAFEGGKTASGEVFSHNGMFAAHRSLPFNTQLRITRTDNGRSVVVRVVDRGPFVNTHTLDISRAAAAALGFNDGYLNIKIEVIGTNSGGTQLSNTPNPPAPVLYGYTAKGGAAQKKKQNNPNGTLVSERIANAPTSRLYRVNLTAPQRKGYAIQVAWMANNENMLRKVADLQRTFKDVMVNEEMSKATGAPVYRILLGPYETESAANQRLRDVRRFRYDGLVVNLTNL